MQLALHPSNTIAHHILVTPAADIQLRLCVQMLIGWAYDDGYVPAGGRAHFRGRFYIGVDLATIKTGPLRHAKRKIMRLCLDGQHSELCRRS